MHCGCVFGSISRNIGILCKSNVSAKFIFMVKLLFILIFASFSICFSSQGIAYRNLLETKSPLYAMVCSTSAKSSVRLINTTSFRDSLQFRCMKIITKYPQLLEKVQNIPGLANLCRDVWFLIPKERYQYSEASFDNQQENNVEVNRLSDDCPDENVEISAENDDINDAIFLSTYKDVEIQPSSDDEPIYDDED